MTAAMGTTPPLWRRLACMVYESLLLFGLSLVPAVVGALFVAQTGKHGALQNDTTLRAFALLLFAVYFVWFWSARGQTLAMQTWRIRVVRDDGSTLGQGRALLRFVAACIGWFGPATVAVGTLGSAPWPSLGLFASGVLLWALLSLAEPTRQFWHDRLCGTRLVDVRDEPRAAARSRPR